MEEMNWRQIMVAYHDKNFSVIPLNSSRISMIKEWSKYNGELPEEPLYKPGQRGVGILPGSESGVMFVDIDSDDPSIVNRLKQILPTSPVQRFGSKGVALAYAYNEKLRSRKFQNIKVELFIDSGYVALPPSHHEKTGGSYKWIGNHSLLDFPKEELPTFSEETIEALDEFDKQVARANPKPSTGTVGTGGRHTTLLSQAFAGLRSFKDADTIARELIQYDKRWHQVSYFTEDHGAVTDDDFFREALKMVRSAQSTLDKESPQKKPSKAKAFEMKSFPEPSGFMKDLIEYIKPITREEAPESALAGAISILAVIIGNRFSFNGIRSNVYVMNLAMTGTGKTFAMEKLAEEILFEAAPTLRGRGSYASESGFWHGLINKKTMLDTVDEVSTLFRRVNESKSGFSENIIKIWDASNRSWAPPAHSILNKDAQSVIPEIIKNPCLSIWGASTIKTFSKVLSEDNYDSGLMHRFLLILKETRGEIKRTSSDRATLDKLKKHLIDAIKEFINHHPFISSGVELGAETGIDVLEISTPETLAMAEDLCFDMAKRATKMSSEVMMGFCARYPQHLAKLAMLHSASRSLYSSVTPSVLPEDLKWASRFLEVLIHNNSLFFSRTSASKGYERLREDVLSMVHKAPGIKQSQLTQKFRGKLLNEVLQDLQTAELILKVESHPSKEKRGRPLTCFYPQDDED